MELNNAQLTAMLMALVSEHWILRDRFAILESLLIEHGITKPAGLDDHVPTPAQAAILEQLRDRLAATIIGAPLAAEQRSVAEILARAGF